MLGQGLITGSPLLLHLRVFLIGSYSSALLMYALRRDSVRDGSATSASGVWGPWSPNLTQILMAYAFVFGESARYVAPPFLAAVVIASPLASSANPSRRARPGLPPDRPPGLSADWPEGLTDDWPGGPVGRLGNPR